MWGDFLHLAMRVHSGYPNLCKLKNKLLDKSHVPRVQWLLCEQRCFRLWRVLPTQICWMWETQYASWSNPASSWALLPTGILVGRVAVVFFREFLRLNDVQRVASLFSSVFDLHASVVFAVADVVAAVSDAWKRQAYDFRKSFLCPSRCRLLQV